MKAGIVLSGVLVAFSAMAAVTAAPPPAPTPTPTKDTIECVYRTRFCGGALCDKLLKATKCREGSVAAKGKYAGRDAVCCVKK